MSATMRVIEIREPGGPDVLALGERERPVPGDGQILVEVAYAGVNGPDMMQRKGLYPPPKGASDLLGLEIAGTVVEAGAAVTRWKVGDRVCGLANGGGYASAASWRKDRPCRCRGRSRSPTQRRSPRRSSPSGATSS